MEEKDQKIEDLEKQVATLKERLRQANLQILSLRREVGRQYHANQDYLPYPDEEDRR